MSSYTNSTLGGIILSGGSSGLTLSGSISSTNYSTMLNSSTGTITIATPTGPISFPDLYDDQIEFFELCLAALGYDIKFNDFKKLSKAKRKSLLRDIKLDRIL